MDEYYEKVKRYLLSKWTSNRSFRKDLAKYYYDDLKILFQYLVPKGQTILEIGCSDGKLLEALAPKQAVGAYLVSEHINGNFPHINFIVCVPEKVPGQNIQYDYILFFNSLGYIKDVAKSLQEAKKVSTTKTRIIITYHNYLWEPLFSLLEFFHLKEKQEIKQNWFSADDLENLLHLTGYEVVEKGGRILFPLNIPLLSPFINKYISQVPGFHRLCLTQWVIARPIAKQKKEYSISIIIPARNEAGTIEDAVLRLPSFEKRMEILFVEGHSIDNTKEEIMRIIKKYPNKEIKLFIQDGKGKGDAVRKGFDAAKGDLLMILDADLTVAPEELMKFYEAIAEGKGEFINGSRLVYPMDKQAMQFLNLIGNKFFSLAFTWLLGQRIKDTLCGTKVLFKTDYERIKENRAYFGDFDPFGDFDLLFGAAKLHLQIKEIPIRYKERAYGATNIRRFLHGWMLIKMCIFAAKKMKFI